jgi:hypothetical protein
VLCCAQRAPSDGSSPLEEAQPHQGFLADGRGGRGAARAGRGCRFGEVSFCSVLSRPPHCPFRSTLSGSDGALKRAWPKLKSFQDRTHNLRGVPDDVWRMIAAKLVMADIASAARVCKTWRRYVRQTPSTLWAVQKQSKQNPSDRTNHHRHWSIHEQCKHQACIQRCGLERSGRAHGHHWLARCGVVW